MARPVMIRINSHCKFSKWYEYQGIVGWRRQDSLPPLNVSSVSNAKQGDWDVSTRTIVFEAHHLSSIIRALEDDLSNNWFVRSNLNHMKIQHQSWLSKQRQFPKNQLTQMTAKMRSGGAMAVSEAIRHRHRIVIGQDYTGAAGLPGTSDFSANLSRVAGTGMLGAAGLAYVIRGLSGAMKRGESGVNAAFEIGGEQGTAALSAILGFVT